ncbi:MAG: haloalkane dehalogenase [Chloroflexota bacterium]
MSKLIRMSVLYPFLTAVLVLAGACTVQLVEPNANGDNDATEMADASSSESMDEISAEMPYETQFVEVNGSQMAYVEAGEGDPILFIHGNPTSKYLWRNVMPHLEDQGRVVALDLIGMGESDKPEIGYTFPEQSEYLEGFISALGLENITLVIHDWGSGLGFDYANRHLENVKAIAFMESAIGPNFPPVMENLAPDQAQFIQAMRTEGIGEDLMLNKNMFIEQFLPSDVMRGLTEAEIAVYRAPYPDEQSRIPMLAWVRQIPIGGEPAVVGERVDAYQAWFLTSELPKLHLYAEPGALNPPAVAQYFHEQGVPNYESVLIGAGNHFVQEDQPHVIGQNIAEWYRRINQSADTKANATDGAVVEEEALPEIPDKASNELILPYLEQKPIPIAGSVHEETIDGAAAGEQTFFVYLPEGYDESEQQYRTLYHLHGAGVQPSWVGYDCTYIGSKIEEAAAAGIIEPMIVVCLIDHEANGMWSDSFDGQHLISTGFTQDLIPHIDTTYRTIAERNGRALQGFSMGGFGTVVNGFNTPELFEAIVVWDGALHFWQSISDGRPEIVAKMFQTEAYFNQWSPWELTKDAADADLDVFIVAGNMEIVVAFNDRFRPHLENVGQPFTYYSAPDCPHSILCLMDARGEEAFQFLAESFDRG